jgi:hypothetical protein
MSAKAFVTCFILPIAGTAACGSDSSPGTAGSGTAATVDAMIDQSTPVVEADGALPDVPVVPGDAVGQVDAEPAQDSTAVDAGACTWPADFTPSGDEYALGCWAHPVTNPCVVPSGDVVGPKGIILDPAGNPAADQSCQFACVASEFALHCAGAYTWPDSGCEMRIIPAPDLSVGCRVLPIPTTPTDSYYCCPCGLGQASLADASVSVSTLCHE